MPDCASTSSRPAADRNLLFGILALQMDFISRDALIAAMNAWVLEKTKPLGQILVEQGALESDAHALLEPLVKKHLAMHGGDPERSLAVLSSLGSARNALEQIADPDVQASLAQVSANRPAEEHSWPTRMSWAGTPTSAGLRFRILRPHARGGLGEVFVAQDEELHREVALKEIQDRFADDPQSRARFLLEAEITGGLEHPGIVPVYGLGAYGDGRPFYAMRFIRGDSLKEAIARFHNGASRGPQPTDRQPTDGERTLAFRQLLGRFVDVCNAVAYAHSRGVLHRDVKPGNVMLGKYGETLVVDWGLAKPVDRPESAPSTEERILRPSSGSGVADEILMPTETRPPPRLFCSDALQTVITASRNPLDVYVHATD
jgi:serine/threonine protein kinase